MGWFSALSSSGNWVSLAWDSRLLFRPELILLSVSVESVVCYVILGLFGRTTVTLSYGYGHCYQLPSIADSNRLRLAFEYTNRVIGQKWSENNFFIICREWSDKLFLQTCTKWRNADVFHTFMLNAFDFSPFVHIFHPIMKFAPKENVFVPTLSLLVSTSMESMESTTAVSNGELRWSLVSTGAHSGVRTQELSIASLS